ncbi:TadE-like protein [Lentibacillus halodurans]|uniref:TadE-like protein n=1 Tax=Lentibacillus halodurans TaxID=237679 RepID=A0A1I0WT36_9BACI|nr:TadE/TadG family type IV pilus assembly protein [Lentibacillus halodurans]SFA91113.1 TadE-like protein [Lentibacillus halodurans]
MKRWKRKFKNEDGSATIEFLGILPLALLLLMIIWQFIVGINGVLVTQSAANEYAKVYSITNSDSEASTAANNILSTTGSYLQNQGVTGSNLGNKKFTAEANVNIRLVFLPRELFGYQVPSIPYAATASSRVIE